MLSRGYCKLLSMQGQCGPGRRIRTHQDVSRVPRPAALDLARRTNYAGAVASAPLHSPVIPPAPGPRCEAAEPVGGRPDGWEANAESTREIRRDSVRWHTQGVIPCATDSTSVASSLSDLGRRERKLALAQRHAEPSASPAAWGRTCEQPGQMCQRHPTGRQGQGRIGCLAGRISLPGKPPRKLPRTDR